MSSLANADKVVADKMMSNMQGGETPLDFIKNNIMAKQSTPTGTAEQIITNSVPQTPEAVIVAPPTPTPEPAKQLETASEFPMPVDTTPTAKKADEGEKKEAKPEEKADPRTVEGLIESVAKPKKTKEDSIKDLRTKTQVLADELAAKDALIAERDEKLKKYETGEALPDVLRQKDERIEQLSKFEQIHSLKTSKVYKEKFLDPLEQAQMDAAKLAEAYKVDPEVLNQAISMEDQKAVDNLLVQNFGTVGALQAKQTLQNITNLYQKLDDANDMPAQTLENLRHDAETAEHTRRVESINRVNTNARTGWTKSLEDIRATEEFPELTFSGEEDHDAMVKQVLDGAATEYSKLLKVLVAKGVNDLSADEAKILAKRFLLSQASSVMAKSRAHHYNRSQEIIKETRSTASYMYPPMGSTAPVNTPTAPRVKSHGEQIDDLITNVLHRNK